MASVEPNGDQTSDEVRRAVMQLSEKHGAPGVDLATLVLTLSDLDLIPAEIARRHVVLPLLVKDEAIFLAMADPSDKRVIEEIEFISGKRAYPYASSPSQLRATIERAYTAHEAGEPRLVGERVSDEPVESRPVPADEQATQILSLAALAPVLGQLAPPVAAAEPPPSPPRPPPLPPGVTPPASGGKQPPSMRSYRPTLVAAPVGPIPPPPPLPTRVGREPHGVIAPPVPPPLAQPPAPPVPPPAATPPVPPPVASAPSPQGPPPALPPLSLPLLFSSVQAPPEASAPRVLVPDVQPSAPVPPPPVLVDAAEPSVPPEVAARPVPPPVPALALASPPAAPPPPPPAAVVAEKEPEARPAQRVALVIDVEDDSRRLLASALEDLGLVVLEANRGAAALAIASKQRPDLVVIDPSLPDLHGFEVCAKLRAAEATAKVPIVMLSSGYRGWRFARDFRSVYGIRTLIEKPFGILDVATRIEAVLAGDETATATEALPPEADAALRSANDAYRRGELDAAIEQLERGVSAAPTASRMHYQLALLLGRRGDVFQAVAALEKSVGLNDGFFPALKNLAVLYEKAGFVKKAVESWERALSVAPDAETHKQIKERLLSLL